MAGAIHVPVMLSEVLTHLAPRPAAAFLDATAGTGGHLTAAAERLVPGGLLFAVDLDPTALATAQRRLIEALRPRAVDLDSRIPLAADGEPAEDTESGAAEIAPDVQRPTSDAGRSGPALRLVVRCGNFAALPEIVRAAGCETFDGVLLDLGLSTWALDDPERGFSFSHDGPLDMRMNPESALTAEQVVNRYTVLELRRIFKEEGEERWAGRIAAAIARRRAIRPIRTTGDLAAIIARAVPPTRGRQRIHPATRAFLAIRATVNEERANLRAVLSHLPGLLKPSGRAAVLAYHSLEDRAVKQAFRQQAREGLVRVVTPKPLRAGPEEQRTNHRSRSACLRVIERLPADVGGGRPPTNSEQGLTR
jgi:16S rRNA (cytosine1402-N4)-methyltransferase